MSNSPNQGDDQSDDGYSDKDAFNPKLNDDQSIIINGFQKATSIITSQPTKSDIDNISPGHDTPSKSTSVLLDKPQS